MSRYGNKISESPESIRKHVPTARNIHSQIPSPKQQKSSAVQICASGDSSVLRITLEGQSLMRSAMSQLQLSARAYHRILKLSRTIADLAGSEEIYSAHLAEALQYRPKIMLG